MRISPDHEEDHEHREEGQHRAVGRAEGGPVLAHPAAQRRHDVARQEERQDPHQQRQELLHDPRDEAEDEAAHDQQHDDDVREVEVPETVEQVHRYSAEGSGPCRRGSVPVPSRRPQCARPSRTAPSLAHHVTTGGPGGHARRRTPRRSRKAATTRSRRRSTSASVSVWSAACRRSR